MKSRTGLSVRWAAMCVAVSAVSAVFATAAQAADPVTINIVDVAGNLQLTQKGFEAFKAKYPNLVSAITFTKAPAPELPGKLKAMQAAGRTDIDLVLTGTDALAAGIEQGLWDEAAARPGRGVPRRARQLPARPRKMQDLAQGYGLEVTFMPAGPLLEYNPAKVKQVADDARGTARVVQGESEQADLCASGQFRTGPHVPDGPAVRARRQGSDAIRSTAGTRPGRS